MSSSRVEKALYMFMQHIHIAQLVFGLGRWDFTYAMNIPMNETPMTSAATGNRIAQMRSGKNLCSGWSAGMNGCADSQEEDTRERKILFFFFVFAFNTKKKRRGEQYSQEKTLKRTEKRLKKKSDVHTDKNNQEV